MINVMYAATGCNVMALTQSLRATISILDGISFGPVGNPGVLTITAHLPDEATAQQQADALAALQAHDPVILTATRDGSAVTLHISKPNNVDSATGVTLVINGTTGSQATPLTSNEATITITSADTVTIGVSGGYPHDEVTI